MQTTYTTADVVKSREYAVIHAASRVLYAMLQLPKARTLLSADIMPDTIDGLFGLLEHELQILRAENSELTLLAAEVIFTVLMMLILVQSQHCSDRSKVGDE
jgi:hypothetical protein